MPTPCKYCSRLVAGDDIELLKHVYQKHNDRFEINTRQEYNRLPYNFRINVSYEGFMRNVKKRYGLDRIDEMLNEGS